jgi:hypothetical protein
MRVGVRRVRERPCIWARAFVQHTLSSTSALVPASFVRRPVRHACSAGRGTIGEGSVAGSVIAIERRSRGCLRCLICALVVVIAIGFDRAASAYNRACKASGLRVSPFVYRIRHFANPSCRSRRCSRYIGSSSSSGLIKTSNWNSTGI